MTILLMDIQNRRVKSNVHSIFILHSNSHHGNPLHLWVKAGLVSQELLHKLGLSKALGKQKG